jgi:4-amino-4-deoxy-L-arabinose transferase-like glycosyltransferase
MGALFFLQILAAIAVAYLPFAGWMSVPWTGDQKVYLSTAIEMQQQQSVLIPYLFGEPSYYKPPLQYWSTLVGMKVFGYSLWGAFLPSVAVTLLAAIALWSVASRVLPKSEDGPSHSAARAAIWFIGSIGTATFGMAAQMEIYLVALSLLAWAFALAYLDRTPRERLRNPWSLYAAFASVGVLAWVKSPLYSVLWVFGYLILLVSRREWREFRSLHFYVAGMFGTVVGASWYLAVLGLDYDRFVSDYIMRETISKRGGNGGTPGELWLALLGFCLPFTLLALAGMATVIDRAHRRLLGFIIAAALPASVFFTVYPYRVSTYLYVLVPVGAVLAAFLESTRGALASVLKRVTAGVLSVVVAYLVWLGLRIGVSSGIALVGITLLGVLACAAGVRAIFRPRFLPWATIALVAWLHAVAVTLGERDLAGLRDFVASNPHRQVAMFDEEANIWHEVGLISVALRRPVARLSEVESVLDALDSGHAVVVTEEQAAKLIPEVHELLDSEEDGRQVVSTPWSRLEQRRHLPVQELLRAGRKLELGRTFQILTLPPPGDWIMPEGGV